MTISFPQPSCSITSSDTVTLNSSAWDSAGNLTGNITISNGGNSYSIGGITTGMGFNNTGTSSTYSVGAGLTTSQLSALNISAIQEILSPNQNFDGRFPDWDRVQKMCKEYPGLKIAFEKFKTTYKLVKDHYDTPEDQRPKP
jgi:hypothetical protein